MKHIRVPKNFPVRPLRAGDNAKDRVTCIACGLSWDDAMSTNWTPAPSGRCPFEYFHIYKSCEHSGGKVVVCVVCGEAITTED